MLEMIVKLKNLEGRLAEERIELERLESIKELIGMKVKDVEDELGYYQICTDDIEKELNSKDKTIGVIVDFDCGLSAFVTMLLSEVESDDEIDWGESELYDSRDYISEEIDNREEIIDQIEYLISEIEDEISYLENDADESEIEESNEIIEDLMDELKDQEEALDYVKGEYPFEDFIS